MNRPIQFRAWDKRNDVMRDWDYVRTSWTLNILNDDGDSELMQFTGLHDKNGKEIYEGDIVKHRKLNRPDDGVMFGIAEMFMSDKPREVRYEGCGFIPLAGWIDDALKDMQWEVIGNIYENPSLLTKET